MGQEGVYEIVDRQPRGSNTEESHLASNKIQKVEKESRKARRNNMGPGQENQGNTGCRVADFHWTTPWREDFVDREIESDMKNSYKICMCEISLFF